jgi:hypothetical protein
MKPKISRDPESNPFDLIDLDKFPNENTRKVAKKIFESIYPKRKTPSPDKHEITKSAHDRQTSLTPIPLKYYRNPKKLESQSKVSKLTQNSFSFSKRPKTCHQKVNSQQYPSTTDESYSKSPSIHPSSSKSIDFKFGSSASHSKTPSAVQSKKTEKSEYFEMINQMASKLFLKTPFFNGKDKRKVVKEKDDVIVLIRNLQNYGIFEGKVKDELIRYSNESRQALDGDRASIVGQIKTGLFDPNKNIIKIKTRIKRKLVKEF